MPPNFIKFHGFGNDYIVIEAAELAGFSVLGDFARRICNRHYGAGADGIAVVSLRGSRADFACESSIPMAARPGCQAMVLGAPLRIFTTRIVDPAKSFV